MPLGTSHNFVKGVAVQPDGKILLVGHCWNGSDSDFCVARLHADGSFDANFGGPTGGGNGKFLLPIGTSHDYPLSLSLQPDGKIVLAGECRNGNKTDFCVARLLHDGSLDTTFDGPTAAGNGSFLLSVGLYSDYVAASVLQPDGKIVLAGSCGNGTNNDFCVARLHGGPFGARQCSLDVDGDGKVSASSDMLIGTRVALGMTGNNVLNGITFAPHATRTTWPDIRTYLVSQCGMVIRP